MQYQTLCSHHSSLILVTHHHVITSHWLLAPVTAAAEAGQYVVHAVPVPGAICAMVCRVVTLYLAHPPKVEVCHAALRTHRPNSTENFVEQMGGTVGIARASTIMY